MVADRVAAGLLGLGAAVGLGGAMAAVASPTAHGLAWPWALPWGHLVVAVDGISAAFLFPTLLVPALAGIYGVGYWSQQAQPESAARVRVFLGLLAGAMTTLLIARDAVLRHVARWRRSVLVLDGFSCSATLLTSIMAYTGSLKL